MKNKNSFKFKKEIGQSVVEYALMFVAVVAVIFFVIPGPVRNSLRTTFDGVFHTIGDSINALIP